MTLGEIVARRRRDALATRAEMLAAARQRFLQESYENVGLRDIARDVGVDVALVSRYFGSKEELFREVLHGDKAEKFRIDVGAGDLPDYLVSLFAATDCEDTRKHTEKLLIVLRSASSPQASAIVHDAVCNDVLEPISRILGGGEDAEIRAGMVLTILFGSVVRSIMSVQPECAEGVPPQVLRKLHALFHTALAEDVPADSRSEAADAVA